ncbi:MAG: sigma-54-dependent Fis family transcriptional regulator [candidate division KSB1 bacterium]|nr:sigma-54-dependent Fis family transcriptional regulator [candidate division KSB1 bacterium]MDZ7274194.1 sigma-54-dependent Fis family transcriptional regulator [candidate division KSB1 bacterium]MDZ7287284.1 sigma-54-dependent Fis family transcriptional regulator [candidate division KSB1 bacterium]MDZ7296792.1 sigma-54-dependent Fis family transcriptional regulator [candidate division KSB1 bacterium]MDZ7347658.1 sigma-54-dependent Fis family transcriptional regulator [candidate division KSB1
MTFELQKHETLLELAEILTRQSDYQESVHLISLTAAVLFDADAASIILINPGAPQTVKTIFRGGKDLGEEKHRQVQNLVIGWMRQHEQPFLSTDLKTDPRLPDGLFEDDMERAVMCAPLRMQRVDIGYLFVLNENRQGQFDEYALKLLQQMAAVCAPFLSNVQQIQEYFETPLPEEVLLAQYAGLGMLGRSKPFVELLRAIESAARCDVRVLLEGQSGTGKERVARAIHLGSPRKSRPFVAVDCGAIPANLLESELFGHIKGAFTGANYERRGLFEEAHGGTLFMDEIANLPYDMQAKLLRVLQEGEIRPLGSNKPKTVDVRIIAAASTSLRKMVAQQQFREDLYYRLHVFPIYVPTLNERLQDIPLLANHFLKKFALQQHKQAASFHPALLRFMQQRQWNGNIRELENFVERLVALASPEMRVIQHKLLPAEFKREFKKNATHNREPAPVLSLTEQVNALEAQLIRQALAAHAWNQSQAARALQISEYTIRYKMDKLGIVKPEESTQ